MSKIQIYDRIVENTMKLRDELSLYGYNGSIVDRLDIDCRYTILGDIVDFDRDNISMLCGTIISVRSSDSIRERILSIKNNSRGYYVYPVDGSYIANELDRLHVDDRQIRVLLICDDEKRIRYLLDELSDFSIRVDSVNDGLLKGLDEIDVVLCDRIDNILEVSIIIVQCHSKPVIVLDDRIRALDRIKIFESGSIWQLPRYVRTSTLLRSIKSIVRFYASDKGNGMMDYGSGVYTNSSMNVFIMNEMERYRRSRVPFCVGILELDHIEDIRHVHGDMNVSRLSDNLGIMMKHYLRKSDVCGRNSSFRYIILFPNTERSGGVLVLNRIRMDWEKVEQYSPISLYNSTVTGTVASYEEGMTYSHFMTKLLEGLSIVKLSGSNRIR